MSRHTRRRARRHRSGNAAAGAPPNVTRTEATDTGGTAKGSLLEAAGHGGAAFEYHRAQQTGGRPRLDRAAGGGGRRAHRSRPAGRVTARDGTFQVARARSSTTAPRLRRLFRAQLSGNRLGGDARGRARPRRRRSSCACRVRARRAPGGRAAVARAGTPRAGSDGDDAAPARRGTPRFLAAMAL